MATLSEQFAMELVERIQKVRDAEDRVRAEGEVKRRVEDRPARRRLTEAAEELVLERSRLVRKYEEGEALMLAEKVGFTACPAVGCRKPVGHDGECLPSG